MAGNGSGTGGAGWDGCCEWVVFVDVGSALHEAHLDECACDESALIGGGDVAVLAWYLGGDLGLYTLRESTSSSGVNNGGVWSIKWLVLVKDVWYGITYPAPSVVTMWTVPEIDPPSETWGRVLPDCATTADMPARVLAPALVFPRPSVMAFLESKTVVSTSVCLLVPAPGMTAPWIPRPVVFPPASPV